VRAGLHWTYPADKAEALRQLRHALRYAGIAHCGPLCSRQLPAPAALMYMMYMVYMMYVLTCQARCMLPAGSGAQGWRSRGS
jgi:hypothetical protein